MYDRIVPEEVNTDASGKKKKKRAMKNVIVELNRRFLRPICKEVREESDSKITAILKDWLDGFSDKTREEPMNVVKQEKAYDFLYPNNNPFVVR
uniref:Uncharacterized protein n=1 Tax=Panagrolaimus superbus TaxID=310955 RepID=A0A914Y7M2_9BILA